MKKTISTILFVLLFSSISYAMGATPGTPEVLHPNVEYVGSIGYAGSGDGEFYYPKDVYASIKGDLSTGIGDIFVADTGNERVQRLKPDGEFVYQFGGFGDRLGKFNTPRSITVDFNYVIYVCDSDNDRIQKFDIRGNPLGEIGTLEVGGRYMKNPGGIALDVLGNIYVTDSENDRILKFSD